MAILIYANINNFPVYNLSFHPLQGVFYRANIFNFGNVQFISFCFFFFFISVFAFYNIGSSFSKGGLHITCFEII